MAFGCGLVDGKPAERLREPVPPWILEMKDHPARDQSPLISPVTPAKKIALRIQPAMICSHR
jgi:hypothetical protein